VNEDKPKPGLDEQTFGKLLEAAYVLQEHNRQLREMEASLELQSEQLRQKEEAETHAALLPIAQRTQPEAQVPEKRNTDYTLTLAEIVEAQHQIQIRHLESEQAMAVVAERTVRITGGSGAGIGILEGKNIRYHAAAGASALPAGDEISLEKAICAICVRTGQVLRTPDVNTEFLFDPELCHRRQIQSLVAVPIYHDGNIVGALELYFDKPKGFAEQDIHTCQLMAGLVTEAIGRRAESALKKSMAEERSSMMAAIEKLRPSLQPFAEHAPTVIPPVETAALTEPIESSICWQCGNTLLEREQFCGKCGVPRTGESERSSLQSKVALAWQMLQAEQDSPGAEILASPSPSESEGIGTRLNATQNHLDLSDLVASVGLEENGRLLAAQDANEGEIIVESSSSFPSPTDGTDTLAKISSPIEVGRPEDAAWRSAAKARDFLEGLSGTKSPGALARFWRSRRGDIYLAIAVIFVAAVIRWGVLSGDPVGANGGAGVPNSVNHRKPVPDANVSTFDKFLIGLGLADAPDVPEYKGNPDTQVWVDLHTALYYCPGSDLYGKTPKGRFTTQRDAQLDQFESASRKNCE
jgi:putative methionine-R-sulfoxide reductase with GAF domain